MDNKVEGNKDSDNKDPKNRQKVMKSASAKGTIGAKAGNTSLKTQNSPEKTPEQQESGNKTIKKEAKTRKSLNKNTIYSDGAIDYAKRSRGM